MFEPIIYFLIGTAFAVGVFWVSIDWDELRRKGDSEHAPQEKKQPDTSCCPASCAEMIGKILLVFVVPWGVFCLGMSVVLGWGLYDEWREHRLLNDKGTAQTAPLLELEKDTSGRNTTYTASYLFDESAREQNISKSQYNRLVGQNTVAILVYEDSAAIVGSKPRYVLIIPIMMMGAMGVLIAGAVVLGLLHWIWRHLGFPELLARKRQRKTDI